MKIQVLMSPGCGHGVRTVELVAEVVRAHGVEAEVETLLVESAADAARLGFPGSPTVRVDGVDIEPTHPTNIGLG
jgi:UDP-N-acetylglucosamine enolpyruvyl transferase